MSEDVIDRLAGISGAALAALRRERPDVVKHLQGSDDAIFARRRRAPSLPRLRCLEAGDGR